MIYRKVSSGARAGVRGLCSEARAGVRGLCSEAHMEKPLERAKLAVLGADSAMVEPLLLQQAGSGARASVRGLCSEARMEKPLERAKLAVLGADSAMVEPLLLQLKSSPCLSEVRLHGKSSHLRGLATDLSHIPARTSITSFTGPNQLKHALQKADIVLVQGGMREACPDSDQMDVFEANAPLVQEIASTCITACPDAIFVVMVEPVNSTMPLFSHVLQQNGLFCPNRVVGAVSEAVLAARTLVASRLGLNPRTVWIPLTGGACPETIVPVVSRTRPGGPFLSKDSGTLASQIRSCSAEIKRANNGIPPSISTGYAVAGFINTIARGLCGKVCEAYPTLVRANLIEKLDYMVLPVEFGLEGVKGSQGLPAMTDQEMAMMQEAIPAMMDYMEAAREYAGSHSSHVAHSDPPIPSFKLDQPASSPD